VAGVTDGLPAGRSWHDRRVPDLPWRLAALPPMPLEVFELLVADLPVEVVVPPSRDDAGVAAVLADADLVLGDWTAALHLTAEHAARALRLAFVQQPSVGVEHIDLDAFAAHGIPVANTAGANAVSVAEWCVGATYAVLRQLAWADGEVRAGRWPQLELADRGASELAGRRVGIIGFGAIGVECAKRYAALGCVVSYWSRRRRADDEAHGAQWRELDDLLATSDVLVVVIASTPQTRGLIDAQRLALLPPGAVVVNAARGGIVDEAALAAALAAGALRGAGFDVFATEPLPADSPLRAEPRMLLSPHAAGATVESRNRILDATLGNLRRAVAGEPVANVCNGVDAVVRRRG
jgi:phosphoglycerate dehydrogenase-like enzyme